MSTPQLILNFYSHAKTLNPANPSVLKRKKRKEMKIVCTSKVALLGNPQRGLESLRQF
jgi:hypothetical protein